MARGFYPENRKERASPVERWLTGRVGKVSKRIRGRSSRFEAVVRKVDFYGDRLKGVKEEELKRETRELRSSLRAGGVGFDLAARGFALVREAADRCLGMRHYDVQLIGGWVLLNGMVAEMQTGEGKTLVATLPASVAALAGIPVHIVTVNDYLAERDASWMAPVYEMLGLRVGTVVRGMSLTDRREAYRRDVTYCTNKELAFDYLKDHLLLGEKPGRIQVLLDRLNGGGARTDRLCLRGLCFGIVDEADSILIDESRTPLIIADAGDNSYEKQVYREALDLAGRLEADRHYTADRGAKTLTLTQKGKDRLSRLAGPLGGVWHGERRREELVRQALVAGLFFHRDKEYLVQDGKVQIIDEYTGRLMADRTWERGLHQLIETKEGCEISAQNETLARISYQRFFRRYLHLAGMTGTAREVTRELWEVYRLHVVQIPTNKPLRRRAWPSRVYRSSGEKWSAVVDRISRLHEEGRPVLVGTRSVGASEHLSGLLLRARLPHRVLNARQDQEEAEIVAEAGRKGQITVATNMAGRGTDVVLGEGVAELGGLHVIATERHEARRIDRQLFGRCGRQGDPGSYEAMASLEDEILGVYSATPIGFIARLLRDPETAFGTWLGNLLAGWAQRKAERRHFLMRRDLMRMDESLSDAMAFSGSGE
jgi:preprotein translocase subunit SecA